MTQVHHVAQTVPISLSHQGEFGQVADRREQITRLEPLQPEGRALMAARTRQKQRAGRVRAEPRTEYSRVWKLAQDALAGFARRHLRDDLPGYGQVDACERSLVGHARSQCSRVGGSQHRAGKAQEDAVIADHALDRYAGAFLERVDQRQRPGAVDPAAEGRMDYDTRLADCIEKRFDDNRIVR